MRKRKTEVDAQIGVLVEIGRARGIATPALAMLCDLIHDIEDGKRAQSTDLLELMVPLCN